MAWLGSTRDDWIHGYSFTGQKNDYYNLLVDGFLDGHLYMKATPSPELYSSDPAVRLSAPYLLDASLYDHHYYLYYGVVPAILAFLPYAALTGQDLAPNFVTLLFVVIGFLFYVRIFWEARQRYFPDQSALLTLLSLGLLAFASVTPVLIRCSDHYEIPVASAYGCAAVALWMLYRALHVEKDGARWVAGASLFLGLAVGGRPNFVFALPVLAAVAIWLWLEQLRRDAGAATARLTWRVTLAAVVPASIIGLLLAAYNYGRFHNPFEFGFDYGMNAFFATGKPVASTAFIWPNLHWYYLTLPVLSPYFPYVFPLNANHLPAAYYGSEAIHGQWPVLVLGLVVAIGFCLPRLRRHPLPPSLRLFVAGLAWIFVVELLFMAVLGIRADRYMPDFQAPLILLLVLIAGYCSRGPRPAGAIPQLWGAAFAVTAIGATAFNFLIALQIFNSFVNTRPKTFATLSYYGNYPIYLLARHGLASFGPVRFDVVFKQPRRYLSAPLLATGTPNHTDVLYADQDPDGKVSLSLLHEGYGAIHSRPLPVIYGKKYTIEVSMGSLYPPDRAPFFAGRSREDIERLKTTVRVLVDGRDVLLDQMKSYDSPPDWIFFGRDPAGVAPAFTGRISHIQRLPVPPAAALAAFTESGMWRLAMTPDFSHPRIGEPILASGISGHGNLLFLEVMGPDTLRFGLDQWGYGASHSAVLKVTPEEPHQLEVFIGPQVLRRLPAAARRTNPALERQGSTMRVWLDGRPVWTVPILINKDTYDFVKIGHNLQGFSSATTYFQGALKREPFPPALMKHFLELNLQASSP